MNIKSDVLRQLESHKGYYISGNKISDMLSVSRNAVWKAVRSLISDGHEITAVRNKGYCLKAESDVLSSVGIEKYLGAHSSIFDIEVHKSLTSTNTVLKERASKGEREGKVIVAEAQTAGRGRLGRSFFSPADTGIYFSILLRPDVKSADATLLTTAAAVAVAQAIETVTGVAVSIKWVNDIFCFGKKVCGILTEGSFDMESGTIDYAVVGIGLNVTPPASGFPEDIDDIAAPVCDSRNQAAGLRSHLIAVILMRFWHLYVNLSDKAHLAEYKDRTMLVGRDICVIAGNTVRKAHAVSIDDEFRLVVRFEDSSVEALSSGEVSIRPREDMQ